MGATTQARVRWFRLTPGRFVIGLLVVEAILWFSDRFGWLGWHKGYAVLTGVAAVGVAMLLMVGWFAAAIIFRLRFQFGIRLLFVLVVVVALPFSWLAVEMKKAREQRDVVKGMYVKRQWDDSGTTVEYDYEFNDGDIQSRKSTGARPVEAVWLRELFSEDFFASVVGVDANATDFCDAQLKQVRELPQLKRLFIPNTQVTDDGLKYLAGLSNLEHLCLGCTDVTDGGLDNLRSLSGLRFAEFYGTKVTDAGVAKLQQALPNCKITH